MEYRIFETHERMTSELPVLFSQQNYCSHESDAFSVGNWHQNLELLYFLKGKGLVYCNGVEHEVSPGCMIVVNTNELHSLLSPNGMEYYCLIVGAAFLADNGMSVDSVNFASLVQDDTANHLLLSITEEFSTSKPYRTTAIRTGVLQLLLYLAREHSIPERKYIKAGENIKQVIGYICANASSAISLDSIAKEVNLDKSHLARTFKKATGMTVVSYLNMVRCKNAKRLLLHKNLSVNEVARRCGFENSSYFAKTFKRFIGCLPSDIQENSEIK